MQLFHFSISDRVCFSFYFRKIDGNGGLEAAFAGLRRVREQQQRQRGPKVHSLHAPEVECIGREKPVDLMSATLRAAGGTTLKHGKGGQFATYVKALPSKPYDGYNLARVIPDVEALVGNTLARILKGLSRPQCTVARLQVQGVPLRSKARGNAGHRI